MYHFTGTGCLSLPENTVTLVMSEILHIFNHSPPPHHQMHPPIERDRQNNEPQFNWSVDSGFPTSGSFKVSDQFQCLEFGGSPFTSPSVDELSMVTAIDEQNQRLKKRKFESAECVSGLIEAPKVKRTNHKRNSKPKMDPKPDYVQVRARRGEATDSHSLAERARRERIKKKMQILQDLVPGCNEITSKAAILDEIINYIQCLQRDVEFLTLKLAASTSVDFMDNLLLKELIQLSEW